jgi:hypothetical protein
MDSPQRRREDTHCELQLEDTVFPLYAEQESATLPAHQLRSELAGASSSSATLLYSGTNEIPGVSQFKSIAGDKRESLLYHSKVELYNLLGLRDKQELL